LRVPFLVIAFWLQCSTLFVRVSLKSLTQSCQPNKPRLQKNIPIEVKYLLIKRFSFFFKTKVGKRKFLLNSNLIKRNLFPSQSLCLVLPSPFSFRRAQTVPWLRFRLQTHFPKYHPRSRPTLSPSSATRLANHHNSPTVARFIDQ
jgi:hypothetical protein